jgi:hypothetical protein
MTSETVLFIGGVYILLLVLLHLMFWKLFDWKNDLGKLSFINRQVMQILNLTLTSAFIIFSYISIFHSTEMLTTDLGKVLLLLISIFWTLRAIQQAYFFGLKNRASLAFFAFFLLGSIIYLWSFVRS